MALTLNDLALILDELHDVCKKWYEIGLRLPSVPVEDLESILSEYLPDLHSLRRVLVIWLRSERATWSVLCEALSNRMIDEPELAEKLRNNFPCIE